MFDLLMKPKFYKKCKSAIRVNRVRLETIKKKRNVVEKYLKKDIAELLRNGLDYNAYGRAEGLLVEQNRTACYNSIEQFSETISKHVSVMQKQSECPVECREAIPSLIYAAARFSDLPELRDLRTIFTERYGTSLESFLNQEFVQKLRAEPPTKEMKLQLMHDIANEFSIEWDSKALEQKLFKPPSSEQNEARNKSLSESDDDGYKVHRSKKDDFQKSNDHGDEKNEARNKSLNESDDDGYKVNEYRGAKVNETDLTSRGRKKDTGDKYKLHGRNEGEVVDQDIPKTTTTSDESVSEGGVENVKPFYYRFIAPPYARPPHGKEKSSTEESTTTASDNVDKEKSDKLNDPAGESKPKPRSVRRRPLKPPPGREGLSNSGNDARKCLDDRKDEEEKTMDELLMQYGQKKLPSETQSKYKANLPLPPGRQRVEETSEDSSLRTKTSDPTPSGRAASFLKEAKSPTETAGWRDRASSMPPDMSDGHVHPKLPKYDDLATRLASLRRG
ncbi:hypothetical protein PTKIN_Ptkin13bG0122200 [Pterospermum kingtungense]